MTGRPGQTRPLAKKKEKEEKVLRRKIFGLRRRRKRRKYLEKKNIWSMEEAKNRGRKGKQYSKKEKGMMDKWTDRQTDRQNFLL